jgi:TM2 domain-containing membrane protein YozV
MWYYQQGNNRMGPVDEATIRSLMATGAISIDTLVWTTGMANWVPLQQTSLASGLTTPPAAAPVATADAGAKSKVGFILLGVFLGSLGIHNFYAGYNKKALIQLLVTVLTCSLAGFAIWIWAIVDICTVEKDSSGRNFS